MNFRTILLAPLFLYVELSTANFFDNPNVYLCNDCKNFQYEADRVSRNNQLKKYYIVDIKNDVIRSYVGINRNPQPGVLEPADMVGMPSSVETEIQQKFDLSVHRRHQLYSYANSGGARIEVPSSIADSAWDLSGSSSTINQVGELIFHDLTLMEKVYAYESVVVALLGKIVDINIVVVVEFSDGSTSLYRISGADTNEVKFEYLEGSSLDKDLNKVADTVEEFQGTFTFTSELAAYEFLQALERYGSSVTLPINCENIQMTCTVDGPNMNCTATTVSC